MYRRHRQRNILNVLNDRSVSEDVNSRKIIWDRLSGTKTLFFKDLKEHFGCVNAIEFSHQGGELIASGGDDRRVLIWNVEKALSDISKPWSLKGEHTSNIFCLAFDTENTKVFSGGNDEQVIVHDLQTGETLDVFLHEDAVYGISVNPENGNVFATACDDGKILVYDIREPPATDAICLASYTSSMHAVMFNPVEPRLLATANAKEGLGLWDVRKPKSCLLKYGSGVAQQSANSVRINNTGDRILALRRRLPPILYNIHSSKPICEFDHAGYFNSCTMKSCCFAGDKDQYILSGSDDFQLYMWKIPEDLSSRRYVNDAYMILHGHRSIVNQVRFNPDNHIIISSGVEKMIKVWSTYPLPNTLEMTNKSIKERPVYSHEEYINLILNSGQFMSHDYSNQSVEEDPRMIAFFDSLVQRELEGNSSDPEMSSGEEEIYERIMQLSRSDISDTSEDEVNVVRHDGSSPERRDLDSDTDSIDDPAFSPFTLAFASVMAAQATDRNPANRLLNALSGENGNNNENQNSRRSISELIAQKRTEMKKRIQNGKLPKRKKTQIDSSDSSDNEQHLSESLSGHPDNIIAAQRQRRHLQLQRLRQLRQSVLQTEEESCEENELTSASVNCHSEPSTSKGNPEFGPFLSHNNKNNSAHSSCVENGTETEILLSEKLNSHVSNQEPKDNVSDHCFDNQQPGCSHDNEGNGEEEERRQNWTEFKRFKNRTKKNKRVYRKHNDKDDN
ncbi:DDB1- and CUL4-associated factor 5-like isoform X2 [Saccostrea echinata]|uniref:DDB1- and CUL4-associated factor 5-like isoform X2 n=1 Tax=Saccostrea echinata TaxID=191078 RepID=UPI002A83C823|nr:DDB1- and CUL4-associated factor 5-like isoform X2 [Saccostrea echinata]